ncbi:KAP family P-loop NTPase fold protein [Paenibacillus mucilaginosus]|nr:P-loop NTPase fold protein [Paenibacillus mucilaginosus]MCG7217890.1 KAP family NTPase [Paenibacillus mucilaginosus]WDM29086.1 hypothetical protein KCX80_07940 [Paenibacillus mucilaginosus]
MIVYFFVNLSYRLIRSIRVKSKLETKIISYFHEDLPIEKVEEDRLNRAPFAERIAKALDYSTNSGFTIGILGTWGSGKSSVYNMVKAKCGATNYHFIEFKPWYFGQDNHDIIRIYLHHFSEEIKKVNGFNPKLAKAIRSYGNLLSSVGVRNFGTVISIKDAFEKFFPSKEAAKLQDIKKEIEEMLKEYPRKIVVYIDDVDRLDGAEVRMIFKLVRLIADFPNVTYIIALDEEVIKRSLSSIYHENNENGSNDAKKYLEKFIQVPIYLPKPDPAHLQELCWEHLSEVMSNNGLIRYYDNQIITYLTRLDFSPRNIFRYINLIQFYLPYLKEEIYHRDLLYLLIVQVSSSELYNYIYENNYLFIEEDRLNKEKLNLIPEFNRHKDILQTLFPYIYQYVNETKKITEDQKKEWEKSKKLCSPKFFNQYFMYGVPKGHISQEALNILIQDLHTQDIYEVKEKYLLLIDVYSFAEVNAKLENRINEWPDSIKEKMLTVLKLVFEEKYSRHSRDTSISIEALSNKIIEELIYDNYRIDPVFWTHCHLVFLLNTYIFVQHLPLESGTLDLIKKSVKSGFNHLSYTNFLKNYSEFDARRLWEYWTDFYTLEEIKIVVDEWTNSEEGFEEFLFLTINNNKILDSDVLLIRIFINITKFLTESKLSKLFNENKGYPADKRELSSFIEKNKTRYIGLFFLAKNRLFKFILNRLNAKYSEKNNAHITVEDYIKLGVDLIKNYGTQKEVKLISDVLNSINVYNSIISEQDELNSINRKAIEEENDEI